MSGVWPLVGRVEELELVSASLRDDARAGIIIAGAAGVGKTRLAREAYELAARTGMTTEWTTASLALASIPFGAVARFITDARPVAPDNRLELLRHITRELAARANASRLLLAVDDAHLLDPGAAALVQHVALSGAARVLLTTRSGEPVLDAITALWKDGHIERLDLQPLSPRDVEQLLMQVLDGPVDPESCARLWELSTGNVLLLREVLAATRESASLTCRHGAWVLSGPFRPNARLRELVDERLAGLSPSALDVLDHVAVGEPLLLDAVTNRFLITDVTTLERAGLVAITVEAGEQMLRCAHPLYQEIVRARLKPARRREIASVLPALLDRRSCGVFDRLRIAAWRLESGDDGDVADVIETAQLANALFDHALAERLARRALALGGGLRASLALGDALNRQSRTAEGEAVLAPLVHEAEADRDRVDVAIARYFGLTVAHGFRREFESVLLDAERVVRDPATRAFLRAQRATLLTYSGDLTSVALIEHAADIEAGHANTGELAALRSVTPLGTVWTLDGHTDRAVDLAHRLLAPAMRQIDEHPHALFWVASVLMGALTVGGRLSEAEEVVASAKRLLPAAAGDAEVSTFLAIAQGMIAVMRGRARAAQLMLSDCVRLGPSAPLASALLVEAYAMTGDEEPAEAAAAAAQEAVAQVPVFEGVLRRARAWLAVARGQLQRGAEAALDAADWARCHGHHGVELFALHDAVRLGRARDALPRLVQLAPASEVRWAPTLLAHARAAADDDGRALEAVAAAFQGIGTHLRAAEAAHAAAAAHRRRGLSARAARCTALARTLLARCDGAHLPDLVVPDSPLLTPREREVAGLAAKGLTSSEIGQRLFLSRRTVEGHLLHVYTKLGIDNRGALARLLDE